MSHLLCKDSTRLMYFFEREERYSEVETFELSLLRSAFNSLLVLRCPV